MIQSFLYISHKEGFDLKTPLSFPLDRLLRQIGQTGKHLSDIGSAEGAAGNISVCVRGHLEVSVLFPQVQNIQLPQ
ncbi:MAG TPA: hypothetical protein VNA23_02485, partial [Anaerolineales bacterium]|nr:hypothetical protein [Anaerolineales bacterium]